MVTSPAATTMRRPRATRLAAALLTVMTVLAAGCGSSDETETTSSASTATSASASASASASSQTSTTEAAAAGDSSPNDPPPSSSSSSAPSATERSSGEATVDPSPQINPSGCDTRAGGVQRFVSEAGGPPVDVRVFVPPDASDRPLAVMLNWHGLGSNGGQQVSLTAYEGLAADEGFIAVHPTGAENSWELAQFDAPDRDDLAMVDDVIDRLVTEFCADPQRIYSTGLSNGGFFTARLVCERADRIAAAVSVAGVTHPEDCQPSRPVPFIAFHGTADEVVLFAGGRSSLETGRRDATTMAFFDQSMPDEFAEFASDYGCDPTPTPVAIGQQVIRHDYLDCIDDVPLSFYEITDGGHTWPGSALGPLLTAALGETTDEVDATVDGWAFVSRFTLPPPGQG